MSLCQKPFIRKPGGISDKEFLMSQEARDHATPFPCGKCESCRINHSRVWKHRIMLEVSCHTSSTFVTLTYDENNLPPGGSLRPRDVTLFLKRLRKKHSFRYFLVGEYGRKTLRAHYHVLLFGIGPDRHNDIVTSWYIDGKPIGYVQTGLLDNGGIGYVCGYVVKGLLHEGDPALQGRHKEFMRCSRNPGIGVRAVESIAAAVKRSQWANDLPDVHVLTQGKKNLPLGKFLSKRLSDLTGLPSKGTSLREYQEKLQTLHSDQELYYDSIQNPDEPARRSRKLRYHFYEKARSI